VFSRCTFLGKHIETLSAKYDPGANSRALYAAMTDQVAQFPWAYPDICRAFKHSHVYWWIHPNHGNPIIGQTVSALAAGCLFSVHKEIVALAGCPAEYLVASDKST